MTPVRLVPVVAAAVLLTAACGHSAAPVTPGPAPSDKALSPGASGSAQPLRDTDWPTYHRDNARTGVAAATPALGTLATAWRAALDGAVYGQPLVVGDTVYAATEHDTVYALAPDTGAVKWRAHLGEPMPRSQLPCGNINPLGITSTMVYDPDTHLVFALAETTGAHHTLYGIDVDTGAVKVTRAAEPPKGTPVAHQQRSALTLYQGRIYVSYGGLAGDCSQYIGSVVGVPTTGTGAVVTYAVPTTREAGMWTPGGAIVQNGRLVFAVGNGESTSGYDTSDSVLALDPKDLHLIDSFSPKTWADDNDADLDLGSMTPVEVGGYILQAGKRGVGYTLKPDHLGGIGGEVAQAEVCKAYGGPAVDHDVAYLPCNDGPRAVRVDPSGQMQVLWRGPAKAKGSPVVGGGAVWVADYDGGVLFALDPATGAVRQQVAVGSLPHFASPTLSGAQAYLGTMTGVVAVSGA